MKIAFLITKLSDVGGAQIHVRDLSTALRAAGHDVTVISGSDGLFSEQLMARGIAFYTVQHLAHEVNPLEDVRGVLELRSLLREVRPDVLSTHSTKAGLVGRIAGRTLRIPTLFTAHGWGFTTGRSRLEAAAFWAAERVTAPWAARIVTVCESDREAAVRTRLVPPERVITVHNAMPDVDPSLRADPSVSPPRLVQVARMVPQKDQPTLLRALAGLQELDWHLDLIGDGPLLGQAQALAESLGIAERVTFLGYRSDVAERLAQAQVFLLITNWEGFPRSILEGMRAALPVVASDVGGVRESVVDGRNGYVVPPGDPLTLRDRLRLLLTDPDLRAQMGAAGRALYEESYTFDRLVARMTEVYEDVIDGRG